MNILILSYACEPSAGSEYEVGWKVPAVMARLHPEMDVYVVTRGGRLEVRDERLEFGGERRETRDERGEGGVPRNLHYLYYALPSWMTYPNERESRWGEQINYALWQLMVRGKVKSWCEEYKIDVVHHLTFNQYRTPSPGYWLDRPFLFGPIGGAECISPVFYQDLEASTLRKEKIRVKGYDRKIFKWFLSRKNTKKTILCSSKENVERLSPYKGNAEMKLVPAIGISPDEFESITPNPSDKTFDIIYAGKVWDWKGLHVVLKSLSISLAEKDDWSLKLVGIRFEHEQNRVKEWMKELHLENRVELIPYIKREDLLEIESKCNLAVYPSFRDSGSMAVLEACALGCPSICFDAGGQDIFPDEIVIKVPVRDSYERTISAFSEKLQWAYNNREKLESIGIKARQWAFSSMNWENKVEIFIQEYYELTE